MGTNTQGYFKKIIGMINYKNIESTYKRSFSI